MGRKPSSKSKLRSLASPARTGGVAGGPSPTNEPCAFFTPHPTRERPALDGSAITGGEGGGLFGDNPWLPKMLLPTTTVATATIAVAPASHALVIQVFPVAPLGPVAASAGA